MADTAAQGWQGLLDPGEQILWQGQPDGRVSLNDVDLRRSLMGLFIMGFALFWSFAAMRAAAADGGPALIMAAAGLFFFVLGAREAFGYLLLDGFARSRTWYTLTDRRGFIATDLFRKRRLNSYPITSDTVLELIDETPGSVLFFRNRGSRRRTGAPRRDGFRRIEDARHVYDLMRKVQRDQK